MAKRPTIEERLAALHELAASPLELALPPLRKALRTVNGLVVATAVEVLAELDAVTAHVDELAQAFARLCEDPVRRDPGCRAKLAIARALLTAREWSDGVFVDGLSWVQKEPVWGGQQDTAADVRGVCAMAHAELLASDAVTRIASLLADPERAARAAAAVALGNSGRFEAIPLLRYKATIGDADDEVHGAALRALLGLDPSASVPFVAHFLVSPSDVAAEAAALALGESRESAAFEPLRDWALADPDNPRRVEIGCIALAMLRSERSTELLVDQITAAEHAVADAAVRALAPYCLDPAVRDRVRHAASERGGEIAKIASRELGD